MVRTLLLILAILLVVPSAASAQKDKMQLGEALGATVKRGFGAPGPSAVTTPLPQDALTTSERLEPEKKKGAR